MPDTLSVWSMANKPTVALQSPAEVEQQANAIKSQRFALQGTEDKMKQADAARGLFREAGGDFRKAATLAGERGLMEHATTFGEVADRHDLQVAQAQKALAELPEAQRKETLARIQATAQATKWVLSQPLERRPQAQEMVARQLGIQELQGQPYDEDRLMLLGSQMDAFGASPAAEKPMTDRGRLWWDLRKGNITQADYDAEIKQMNAPKQPLVQVGFSQPFEVTDPQTGKPALVQQDKAGNLRPVVGYGPKSEAKPLTDSQANALGFGVRALEANQILSKVENAGVEVGGGVQKVISALPGGVGQYATPAKLQQYNQAKSNFITAVLRKESGAVIGENEFRVEDQKYFPQPGDSPLLIAQKRRARQTAIKVLEAAAGRPLNSIDTSTPAQPGVPKPVKVWTIRDDDGYAALPPGAHYKGPDGVERIK